MVNNKLALEIVLTTKWPFPLPPDTICPLYVQYRFAVFVLASQRKRAGLPAGTGKLWSEVTLTTMGTGNSK